MANGVPTQDDLERTVKLILHKARRVGSVDTVEFSRAGVRAAHQDQVAWVEEQVAKRGRGLRIAWVIHS